MPEASPEEYDALKADIAANGLLHPVIVHVCKGGLRAILDGRHRYRACWELGIDPRLELYTGSDPAAFVISVNLARRHLSASQRSMVAARLVETTYGGDRRSADREAEVPLDRARAAGAANVSTKSIQQAQEVIDHAPAAVVAAAEAGTVAVSDAAAVAKEDPAVLEAALGRYKAGGGKGTLRKEVQLTKRDAAKEAALASPPAEDGQVWECRAVNLRSYVDEGSLDAIFTDPPYTAATMDAYAELAKLALHGLKPGGLLIAETQQHLIPETLARLAVDGLHYRWTLALLLEEQPVKVRHANVSSTWRPLVVYERMGAPPSARGRYGDDLFRDQGRTEGAKEAHAWGKHASTYAGIAKSWLRDGWHVADPFCGTGALMRAAKDRGCTVVGCDIDPAHVASARRNLK